MVPSSGPRNRAFQGNILKSIAITFKREKLSPLLLSPLPVHTTGEIIPFLTLVCQSGLFPATSLSDHILNLPQWGQRDTGAILVTQIFCKISVICPRPTFDAIVKFQFVPCQPPSVSGCGHWQWLTCKLVQISNCHLSPPPMVTTCPGGLWIIAT